MGEEQATKENPVIIRPSFKKICENDACRAAIYNQLLYCIGCKAVNGSEYWYGSFEQIYKDLDECWSLSKIRQEIQGLINQGLIGQRHNEQKKWDRTLQYFFNKEHAQKLKEVCHNFTIDLSAIGLSNQTMHLLKTTNAFVEKDKSKQQIKQIETVKTTNPSVKNNGAIPKVTTEVTKPKVTTEVTKKTVAPPIPSKPNKQPTLINFTEEKSKSVNPLSLDDFNLDQPATIKTILLLGDALRGNAFVPTKRPDSKYQRALIEGATPLSQRLRKNKQKGYTLREIVATWNFLHRNAPDDKPWLVAEDWWIGKSVDLWVVANHIDKALDAMARLEKQHGTQAPPPEPQYNPDELVIWSKHYPHEGCVADNWWLYDWMPLHEAQQHDYTPQLIPQSVHNEIENYLELIAEGKMKRPDKALATVA